MGASRQGNTIETQTRYNISLHRLVESRAPGERQLAPPLRDTWIFSVAAQFVTVACALLQGLVF